MREITIFVERDHFFCENYSYQTTRKVLMKMVSEGVSLVVFKLKIPDGPNLCEACTI